MNAEDRLRDYLIDNCSQIINGCSYDRLSSPAKINIDSLIDEILMPTINQQKIIAEETTVRRITSIMTRTDNKDINISTNHRYICKVCTSISDDLDSSIVTIRKRMK